MGYAIVVVADTEKEAIEALKMGKVNYAGDWSPVQAPNSIFAGCKVPVALKGVQFNTALNGMARRTSHNSKGYDATEEQRIRKLFNLGEYVAPADSNAISTNSALAAALRSA